MCVYERFTRMVCALFSSFWQCQKPDERNRNNTFQKGLPSYYFLNLIWDTDKTILFQLVQDQEKGTSDVKINIVDFSATNSLW